MRERGMIFNAEMVRAVLDGRKTQTRRIMKVQPEHAGFGVRYITESINKRDTGKYFWSESNGTGIHSRSKPFCCPFGAVGDRLWVRETWARYNISQYSHDMAYRATTPDDWPKEGRWRPSIHMPRWASRITLEITGVRVEQLQDINEADAVAEGIELLPPDADLPPLYHEYFPLGNKNGLRCNPSAAASFAGLWQSIYGEESWQANPWVWVIEFKRIEGEV